MDDLAMTCSDFVNALKMLICSEKHPVSIANYVGYEPAGLTVHPPPQNDRGQVNFFRMGV